MDKPGLAILVGQALAKKGKMHESMPEETDDHEGYSSEDEHAHLVEIMTDFCQAIKDEDYDALADLFKEAFECCEMSPHEEGPHTDDEEEHSSY